MKGHSSHLEEALSTKFASGLIDNINRVKECEEKVRQLQSYHDKLRDNTEQLQNDITKHKAEVNSSLADMRAKFTCLEEEMAKLLISWWKVGRKLYVLTLILITESKLLLLVVPFLFQI